MEREIEFRAYVPAKHENCAFDAGMYEWEDVKTWAYLWEMVEEGLVILLQYTGLKDKNVCEDDIIAFTVFDHNDNDTQYKGVVKFHDGEWQVWKNQNEQGFDTCSGAFSLYWLASQDDELEVIGSIHTHPELMEKDNE